MERKNSAIQRHSAVTLPSSFPLGIGPQTAPNSRMRICKISREIPGNWMRRVKCKMQLRAGGGDPVALARPTNV
jgi:hypothetical protein